MEVNGLQFIVWFPMFILLQYIQVWNDMRVIFFFIFGQAIHLICIAFMILVFLVLYSTH